MTSYKIQVRITIGERRNYYFGDFLARMHRQVGNSFSTPGPNNTWLHWWLISDLALAKQLAYNAKMADLGDVALVQIEETKCIPTTTSIN